MQFGNIQIITKQGDITKESVDVIVNAANSSLLGGGGVDGAIHRAGGETILEECKKYRDETGICSPGQAMITTAGKLQAKYVIHTVGPIWRGGDKKEKETLYNAYTNSLSLAAEHNARSIAFPAIGTGVYGYPKEEACVVACQAVQKFASQNSSVEEVRFILFSENDLTLYQNTLHEKHR